MSLNQDCTVLDFEFTVLKLRGLNLIASTYNCVLESTLVQQIKVFLPI
jgi:hypothetical protein